MPEPPAEAVILDTDVASRSFRERLAPRLAARLVGKQPIRGGRLMYMGGNGYYWRISFSDELPGVIEVRKGEGGIRAWAAEPGEYYNAFTGEYSGLWRRSALPPQQLVGSGFTAQGFDVSSYYRRHPGSFHPRAAFIFEGIGGDELLGNFGLIGGGAAGLELDRADLELGTPPHALVLASSEGHTDIYLVVLEEILINYPGATGSQSPLVRADMIFFETPSGGAVFSVSSIAYSGSLSHNRYDNNISRITENVLRRFIEPKPFDMPALPSWPSWQSALPGRAAGGGRDTGAVVGSGSPPRERR